MPAGKLNVSLMHSLTAFAALSRGSSSAVLASVAG